ncbi:NYN domain limkain-b1-type [Arabidopsis suecica]|uniref:NYN domain limkain-b1-type n=1 Tax=Arabidopsis suecica TaxID=45249 RepID=A0A8T2AGT2_ARASU|nr:NYN domain limkain-b1-type [Arabidopsis suecica]
MTTTVWWDINGCPVPDDYDVGKVGPCIKLALAKLGIDGPITINAMGDLKEIPDQVLKSLTSSGICVAYFPFNIVLYTGLLMDYNLPPDTQVFIMDYHNLLKLSAVVFSLKERGYNIVLVCPEEPAKEPPEKLPQYAGLDLHRLPWESVLQDAKISETCSVNCRICHLGFSSLADFTVHLNSEKHANLVDAMFSEPPKIDYEDSSEDDEDLDEQDDPKKQKT